MRLASTTFFVIFAIACAISPVAASAYATVGNVTAPTSCPAAVNTTSQCTQGTPCGTSGETITFYVPHAGTNCETSLEGCIATSRKNLVGVCEPMTVDAVRLGQSQYASCASDPSNYGKYFNMGTITYRSALDMQMHTVPNVICYVNDTGSAFTGRPNKLDLATTVCPTCTDAQASALAVGTRVNVAGIGPANSTATTPVGTPYTGNIPGTTQNPFLASQNSALSSNPFSTNPIVSAQPLLVTQPTQACTPQYYCSANTVYYESGACVTQVFQACQYGCSGTVCTPAPSQSASSSVQNIPNSTNPILTTVPIGTSTVVSLENSFSGSVEESTSSQESPTSIITTIIAGTGGYTPEVGQTTFSSNFSNAINTPPTLPPLQQLFSNLQGVLASILNFLSPPSQQSSIQLSQ